MLRDADKASGLFRIVSKGEHSLALYVDTTITTATTTTTATPTIITTTATHHRHCYLDKQDTLRAS